jgi:hypothetical protein
MSDRCRVRWFVWQQRSRRWVSGLRADRPRDRPTNGLRRCNRVPVAAPRPATDLWLRSPASVPPVPRRELAKQSP